MSASFTLPPSTACLVVGVGEGIGAALSSPFAAGYKVAPIARSGEVVENVANEINAHCGSAEVGNS